MPALVNMVLSTSFPPPDPPSRQEEDKEFTRLLVDTTSASVEDLQSRIVAVQRESSQVSHCDALPSQLLHVDVVHSNVTRMHAQAT